MRRVALAVVAAVVAGCDVGPALVPVTGTVSRDGKPLAGVDVIYAPDLPAKGLQAAEAKTGKDGRYKVATGPRWGAAPGKYRVSVTSGTSHLRARVGDSVTIEGEFRREVPPMGAKIDLDVSRKAEGGSY